MVIIDSYSDSSYLADQVLADLPPVECWFYRFQLWQLIFHSYFQNSYLAHQVLPDLVPMSNGDYRFLLWELIFGRPSVGRYTPLFNADFTDSCFDSSYFIPTLRTHIWQTRCWQIFPPYQMAIVDSYSENSYLSDLMLADLPPIKWLFHRLLLWQLIFHSYSESSYLSDQVLADLHPKWQFHRLLLWQLIFHSYSESSYLADQVLADLTPLWTAISQIPILTAHISFLLWELIFVWPSVGRSIPMSNGNYRFLLWELIFGRPSVGRSIPLKPQFHKFLRWQLIFHSYSESSY